MQRPAAQALSALQTQLRSVAGGGNSGTLDALCAESGTAEVWDCGVKTMRAACTLSLQRIAYAAALIDPRTPRSTLAEAAVATAALEQARPTG